jgi:hypothetical protein
MQKQTEEISRPQQTTLIQDLVALARYGLTRRRGIFIIGAGFAISGLYFGWDWLVAAGLAPILIALAPCAVMCGLGLCMMNRKGGNSCSSSPDNAGDVEGKSPTKSTADSINEQPVREVEKR